MLELLPALQTALQHHMHEIRRTDINIVPDLSFIPQGTMFPCLGIKDGQERYRYFPGSCREVTSDVHLVIYVSLSKKEYAVLGKDTAILPLAAKAITFLENNLLGIAGVQSALPVSSPASQLYIAERDQVYLKKTFTMQYEQTEVLL